MYRLPKTGLLAAMLAIGILTVTSVQDEHVDATLNNGHVWGTVTINEDYKDETKWNLKVHDMKANNRGVWARIVIDKEGALDAQYDSGITVGGKDLPWVDKKRIPFTRGAASTSASKKVTPNVDSRHTSKSVEVPSHAICSLTASANRGRGSSHRRAQ